MKILRLTALFVMALGMMVAGTVHFAAPRSYLRIVPEWLPYRMAVVYGSGVLELIAGIGLFLPAYRSEAALLVLSLMAIFLPLHIWDCFREHPALGSKTGAIVRLFLQFVLIAWAWWLLQSENASD